MENNPDNYRQGIEGKIIYLHPTEGWGFINTHEIKFTKVYFHWTALNTGQPNFSDLKRMDTLKFDAIKRDLGWKAININVVENANNSTQS